jgi:hypothetical protein
LSSSLFSMEMWVDCEGFGGLASETTEDRYVRRPSRLSWIRVRRVRRERVYSRVRALVMAAIGLSVGFPNTH